MNLNPFHWLRTQAAKALVAGVADGMRAITPDGEDPPANLDELRALLASAAEPKQLAAHGEGEEDEPVTTLTKKGRGK